MTPADASTYRYCYTLLHTYAHVVMKAVSEFSGLDMGSLSEYIFLVMTPFLDADGLDRVLSLFELTGPEVERCLVVRDAESAAITAVKQQLTDLGVSVYEFRLAKGAGQHETFHAKVVVADNDQCYLGSSNMTTWSFNYSLELGFYVQGDSARRTSEIVDAVLSVSRQKT